MATPYQMVQPHFPNLSMKEIETLIGDTWDFHCHRDQNDPLVAFSYVADMAGTLECTFWTEEEWLSEINCLLESRRSKQAA